MAEFCKSVGLDIDSLIEGRTVQTVERISNGLIIEIFNYAKSKGLDVSEICQKIGILTKNQDISIKACLSKIYRVLKSDKERRGKSRDEFRNSVFTVPTETVSSSTTSASFQTKPSAFDTSSSSSLTIQGQQSVKIEALEQKLKERRDKVEVLRTENKQLKRKLERREKSQEARTEKKVKVMEKEFDSKFKQQLQKRKATYSSLAQHVLKVHKLKYHSQQLLKNLKQTQKELKKERDEKLEIQEMHQRHVDENDHASAELSIVIDNLESENQTLRNEKKDLNTSVSYLESLVDDKEEVDLLEKDSHTYSNETVQCAMNLTNLKVATRHVGPVIKEVGKLLGKTVKNIPARQTVDTFVDRKAALAHRQLSDLASSKSTTLYTDETRKYGHTYETYIVSDETQNTYVLGLREMANKSAASTMDTFREILADISNHCDKQEGVNVGMEVLGNITNTMSDRASTEKSFNSLLQKYREQCLPQIVEKYDELSEEQKQLCGQMNNFFCGLHLLVGMADVCESAIVKFEDNYLDSKELGSGQDQHLKKYHKSESGTLRLLRTSSKVCAMGEDEKSGASLPWKTHLKEKKEKNHIMRFKHNRFNMVFMIAGAVFYHASDIAYFLEKVHGTNNDLLRAVSLDVKEDLYLAGSKCLGLISKLVTSPLWRLIETPGHILDMNDHLKTLVDFLENASNCPEKTLLFMKGENSPFDTEPDRKDVVMSKLLEPNEKVDELALPMLQSLFIAMKQLILRMVPEHLPGGKYWNPSERLRERTMSLKKHNKLPEFVFGLLDHLLSFRPNASLLANEAYIMYSHNKTSLWLDELAHEDRMKYMAESRKDGRELRKTFKERIKVIEEKRLEQQRLKQKEVERKEEARIRNEEKWTNNVCYYGLWQSQQQIEEGLADLNDNKEKELALKAQLTFRKNVLKQKHKDMKVFTFSHRQPDGKYKKFSVDELKTKVQALVKSALDVNVAEVKQGQMPLFVGKEVDHKFDNDVFRGHVISIVPGFSEWYNIQYKGDSAVYAYNLKSDYNKGNLKIVVG